MKPITILGSAPSGLTQYLASYHANQSWTHFRNQAGSSYNELRRALVYSQHRLCGYCETYLVDDDTQIEHVIPTRASADGNDYDLDYTNMIACCKGGTAGNYFGPDTRQHDPDRVGGTSCGQAKGGTNDQLFLDPRNLPILRSLFRVQSNGNIDADEDACKSAGIPACRVKRTIEILCLNPNPPKGCSHAGQTWDVRERDCEGLIPIDLAVEECGSHAKRMLTARSGGAGRDYQGGMQQETLGDRPGSGLRGVWVVWWMGQAPTSSLTRHPAN